MLSIKIKSPKGISVTETGWWSLAEEEEGVDLAAAAVLEKCPA